MSISERIAMLCKYEGSQKLFSEKTGIRQQTVSGMIARQTNIRSDNIIAIVKAYPNLNIDWFITGKGSMWLAKPASTPPSPDDKEKEMLKDELIALQKTRIEELQRAIRERAPELAKWLKL